MYIRVSGWFNLDSLSPYTSFPLDLLTTDAVLPLQVVKVCSWDAEEQILTTNGGIATSSRRRRRFEASVLVLWRPYYLRSATWLPVVWLPLGELLFALGIGRVHDVQLTTIPPASLNPRVINSFFMWKRGGRLDLLRLPLRVSMRNLFWIASDATQVR